MISPQICAAFIYSSGASFWPRNTTTECFASRPFSLSLSAAFFRSTPRTSTPVCGVSARISMSVHPVLWRLALQHLDHLHRYLERAALLRLERAAGAMRRAYDIRQRKERRVLGRRLALPDIEPGGEEAPALQRVEQRRLVDDAAARGVDDDRGLLHQRELRRADHVPGLGGERDVDAHQVALPQKVLQFFDFLER